MGFHEVRFPATLSFGSVGGPERRTEIVTLANGFEERNTPWAHSRRRYDAGLGLRSLDDVEALIAFFEARRGQLYGFRWKDWADYKSCAASKPVGTGGSDDRARRRGDAGVRAGEDLCLGRAELCAADRQAGGGHGAGGGGGRSRRWKASTGRSIRRPG